MTYRISLQVKPNLDWTVAIFGEHNLLKAIGALHDCLDALPKQLKPPPFDVSLSGFRLDITVQSPNKEPVMDLFGAYTKHEILGVIRVAALALEQLAVAKNQGLQDKIQVQ